LVDNRSLENVETIPTCERLFARDQDEHTFKRRIDAERYRLRTLSTQHKVNGEMELSVKYLLELENINEEHPEWLI